ncbi:anaerobic ribonucleoside-triphosphate reductase activating protein [Pseudaquidulcibacter saccharophilus]|uniref:anaerobic ribonucleoside-triphosphate reductase activating protein n=1 Tax=Pseudaquidulcibacter saccharophilus TaxID=2831900 RepID=UPI001EFF0E4F
MQKSLKLPIASITPITFQDFPDHIAAIIWFMGCNMRCSYCHNPDLVLGKYRPLRFEDVVSFLNSRSKLLQGIVLSGGECTLAKDFIAFASLIKELGFKVKIDTNGSNPQVVREAISLNLVDYVAIDFKAPNHKFEAVTKLNSFDKFVESLDILISSDIDFEVRTTVDPNQLLVSDIVEMQNFLKDRAIFNPLILQNFIGGNTLSDVLGGRR